MLGATANRLLDMLWALQAVGTGVLECALLQTLAESRRFSKRPSESHDAPVDLRLLGLLGGVRRARCRRIGAICARRPGE